MKKSLLIILALLLLLCPDKARSQQIPDNTAGRLWGLCKVWGYMKYYHPKICQTNWDSLVNEKIPLVMAATSNADYNAVLLGMVQDLGQLTPAQATTPAPADSNLNLDTVWMHSAIFSPQLSGFLDTFYSRAGRNDSIMSCYVNSFFMINEPLSIHANYTNVANRLTIAFNFWNNFNYFSPYRDLIDHPWDSVLIAYIPDFINAPNRRAFDTAFRRMHAHIDDSHGSYFGQYNFIVDQAIGIRVQRIENKAVVTKVYPGVSSVQPGDVVLEINGEAIDVFTERYRPYIPASNDYQFYNTVYPYVSLGSLQQPTVNLKLRNAAQQEYTVTLIRNISYTQWLTWIKEDTKPEWSILCNGYGYVNMNKLTTEHVGDMYAALKNQPAIVFDVRSYLKSSIDDIIPLFAAQRLVSARLWNPALTSPGRFQFKTNEHQVDSFYNPAPYSGQLYFLVNEQTISAAEYFTQYMQQLPNATVIGSQTAGADGGRIIVYLGNADNGGNLMYTATYSGVSYLNGYQCQRNGLFIDDPFSPSINGIRQGIDDVLAYVTGCTTASLYSPDPALLKLTLYPNPATQELTLNIATATADKATIRISDIIGKTVQSIPDQATGTTSRAIPISVSDLSPGIYFINIQTAKGHQQSLKFVKQ
jgi:C-terminal processing protease CtpA/Prc